MKAKKLLAISLATLMLILALPISAFAENTYIAEVTVENPHDTANPTTVTKCTTWTEVITAATALNGYHYHTDTGVYDSCTEGDNNTKDYTVRTNVVVTIKILQAEITVSNMDINCTLVIDGEYASGQQANVTCPNGYWVLNNNNVTMKNLNVKMTWSGANGTYPRMLIVNNVANQNATIKLENIAFDGGWVIQPGTAQVITVNDSSINLIKGNAVYMTSAATVTFNNSVITKSSTVSNWGVGDIFETSGSGNNTLNLHNTVVTQTGGDTSWAYSNIIGHAGTGELTLNLTGTTTLNANSKLGGNGACMFFGWNHPMTVNIGSETDDGSNVVLNLGAPSGETTLAINWPSFFRRFSSLEINDRGGNWVVNEAHSAESGKYGARFYFDDGYGSISSIDSVLALTQNGSFYNPFGASNIPAGTFKTIMSSETFVENHSGAQIRTVKPDGIRFQTNVNKDYYTLFGDNATYGMKATTDTLLGTAGTVAAAEGKSAAAENWLVDGESFLTVLTGFESTTYHTVFCVNSYMTLTYDVYNGVAAAA